VIKSLKEGTSESLHIGLEDSGNNRSEEPLPQISKP
jgi:hypothetical protein